MKTKLETLIEEAKLQAEEHPSKDARWFANSVHDYLTQRKPLTDEEIQKCYETTGHCQTLRPQDKFAVFALARAIEAKVKEKNHD